jgi:hypothetical protein
MVGDNKCNIYDLSISHEIIDSVKNYLYISADLANGIFEIYNYIFYNTHPILRINTNKDGKLYQIC